METITLTPVKPILQPTYPSLPPAETEVDYRNSKQVNICELAAPDWDTPPLTSNLQWVYAKRDLRQVTEYLRKTRAHAASEYKKNDVLWQELQGKEMALRQNFIKFEQFVVENEDKRRRARRKIVEEKLLMEDRDVLLNTALQEQADLVDVKQKLDQKTREFRIYEDFLNQVVGSDTLHYKTIVDVINRYMILMETKDQVSEKRARDMDELDGAKIDFSQMLDEKDLAVMMLNSQMVALIVRHDRARSRALLWESIVTEIKDIIEQKHMELTSVKLSMWNMYKQMCVRQGVPKEHTRDNFEGQLIFIKKTLFELRKVCGVVEKLLSGKSYTGYRRAKKAKHIKIQEGEPEMYNVRTPAVRSSRQSRASRGSSKSRQELRPRMSRSLRASIVETAGDVPALMAIGSSVDTIVVSSGGNSRADSSVSPRVNLSTKSAASLGPSQTQSTLSKTKKDSF